MTATHNGALPIADRIVTTNAETASKRMTANMIPSYFLIYPDSVTAVFEDIHVAL